MELNTRSHRWEARLPDWPAAAVSGFVAGAALMVLELLWAAMFSLDRPWETSHMVAAIVMGRDVLSVTDFSLTAIAVALFTHYLLGILFGIVLSAIIASFRLDSSMQLALATGALFGLLLYLINFYAMVSFFPWFAEMRGWDTLFAHLIFGMVAAGMYRKLEQRT